MAQLYYGLVSQKQLREYIVAVCSVLGYGGSGGYAVDMLIETAAQETHAGKYRDPTPEGAGRGLFQMDVIAFNDIRNRTGANDIRKVIDNFGIDIRTVTHQCIDFSPLLAAIFCRLFYKLIPDAIPSSVEGRAAYWKRFYNTESGVGNAAKYVQNVRIYGANI